MGHFPLRQRGKADAGFFMHERQAAAARWRHAEPGGKAE